MRIKLGGFYFVFYFNAIQIELFLALTATKKREKNEQTKLFFWNYTFSFAFVENHRFFIPFCFVEKKLRNYFSVLFSFFLVFENRNSPLSFLQNAISFLEFLNKTLIGVGFQEKLWNCFCTFAQITTLFLHFKKLLLYQKL